MPTQPDDDPALVLAARGLLNECERQGFRVFQRDGLGYVEGAPRHIEHAVYRLAAYIGDLLDADCGHDCEVERLPGTSCLLYRPGGWQRPRKPAEPKKSTELRLIG